MRKKISNSQLKNNFGEPVNKKYKKYKAENFVIKENTDKPVFLIFKNHQWELITQIGVISEPKSNNCTVYISMT